MGKTLLEGPVKDNLYSIPAQGVLELTSRNRLNKETVGINKKHAAAQFGGYSSSPASGIIWHRRLGHPAHKITSQLKSNKLIPFLDSSLTHSIRDACQIGKNHPDSRSSSILPTPSTTSTVSLPLVVPPILIHGSPIPPQSSPTIAIPDLGAPTPISPFVLYGDQEPYTTTSSSAAELPMVDVASIPPNHPMVDPSTIAVPISPPPPLGSLHPMVTRGRDGTCRPLFRHKLLWNPTQQLEGV
ncbi:hypothetical protein F0562_001402 [Nyssa sinensis]|uniref:GAG-pre-integrase domain-containing protein n=1 Tax=Nyssa sinensis TaxID=561372 RepID=A0A5J5C6J1_9ASTE|nr:hypothetical protein F0562_001402 [Nyssa sinensis]